MKRNPLLETDFYKVDHRRQYPEETTMVYSNLTARSGKLSNLPKQFNDDKVVFFGLKYFIEDYLKETWNEGFFNRDKQEVVNEYKELIEIALGKDVITFEHIESLHNLGYLPLEFRALPELSAVSYKVPMMTIHNTLPEFYWLTNYIETALSATLWKPCTSATTARWYRKCLEEFAQKTSDTPEFVDFQAHDFSMRGMSNVLDSAISGAAHLQYFKGTDSIPAISFLKQYYGKEGFIGGSVPSTEHSVMCMGGKESESETFKRLLTEVYPTGIVSIVSDTWDFWNVCTNIVSELKDIIMQRDGKLVIRPDSGDPVDIICGNISAIPFAQYVDTSDINSMKSFCRDYIVDLFHEQTPHGEQGDTEASLIFTDGDKYYSCTVEIEWGRYDKRFYYIEESSVLEFKEVELTPEQKGAVECLWEIFGGEINSKGYKVLDSHIGLIYGDSITPQRTLDIMNKLKAKGFASTNIVLGIGSYAYNYVTRDTHGFAVKSTYGEVNGKPREIFKQPKTDNGTKNSAVGKLRVVIEDGEYKLLDKQQEICNSELSIVYLNGVSNV
jgi:nicotinamide phosphoribosyltransferase